MIAIVILNYNGQAFLARFLPAVLLHSGQATIYVADNASTDDSLLFLKENYAETVKTIVLNQNYGFAEGYNQALKQVDAKYFLLLNSDVEVTEGWLQPLVARLESDARIAAVQPKILAQHTRQNFEYAGASGGFIDSLGYPICRGRLYDICETDTGQYDDAIQCFWATGAAMLVRADVYRAIGGLDGDFFAHMEEIDWCWRVKRAGYKVMVEPKSTVFHVGGGTLPKTNPRKTYLNFRNSLITLLKNEKTPKIIWLFPLRLILDGVAAALFLSKGRLQDILMIVRAHWFVFGNIFGIIKKRKQTAKTINAMQIGAENINPGRVAVVSIWSYFIQKKQTFNALFT